MCPLGAHAIGTDLHKSEQFQSRLCKRVFQRFSENSGVLNRVNRRIERRFGFHCASIKDAGSLGSTKIEVEFYHLVDKQKILNLQYYSLRYASSESGVKQGSIRINSIEIFRPNIIHIILEYPMSYKKMFLELINLPLENNATLSDTQIVYPYTP